MVTTASPAATSEELAKQFSDCKPKIVFTFSDILVKVRRGRGRGERSERSERSERDEIGDRGEILKARVGGGGNEAS